MKKQFLLSLMAMLLPLTSWAQGELTVEVQKKGVATAAAEETPVSVVYNGIKTTESLEVKVYKTGDETKTPLVPDKDYELIWGDDITIGENTVEAYGIGSYKKQGGTGTFTVTRKPITGVIFELETAEKVYGETDDQVLEQILVNEKDKIKGFLAPVAEADEDAEYQNFLSSLVVQRENAAETVGSYDIILKGNEEPSAECKYEFVAPGKGYYSTLTITKRPLTVILLDEEKKDYIGRAYTGVKFDFDAIISSDRYKFDEGEGEGIVPTDENKEIAIKSLAIATPTDATEIKNVANYTLTATLTAGEDYTEVVNNYEVKPVKFEITPAAVTIKAADGATDLSSVYTGTGGEILIDKEKLKYEGAYAEDDYKDLIVKVAIETPASVKDDYNDFKLYQKGTSTNTLLTADGVAVYGNYTYKFDDALKYAITPKSIGEGYNPAKDFTVTPVGNNQEIEYQGLDLKAEANKDLMTALVNITVKDGDAKLNLNESYTLSVVPVEGQEGKVYNAGDEFTLVIKGTGNYEGYLYKNYKITPAPLKIISTKECIKLAGKDFDPYNGYFEVDGFVGEDKEVYEADPVEGLKKLLNIYATTDGTEVRVLTREFSTMSPLKAENYIINEQNNAGIYVTLAQLKVLDANLILFGSDVPEDQAANSEKLAQYNGLDGVTVTIKNFKEMLGSNYLVKNAWHSMALPFATTAKAISTAFGYAVVNIPNEANATPGVISFKLTVGDVPANHLFLVKLADRKNFGEEDAIEFKDVKIVYNPNEAGEIKVKDEGDNYFYAVYEEKELPKDPTLFVAARPGSTGGGFWDAKANNITVYPLNGYIESGDKSAAATRFFVEEADGSTTAINAITGETISNSAEGWYSIDGMKLNAQPTQKGVYINNGKKVVIK